MTNLSSTIIAKSDQLNADDLIGRSITIKVSKVSLLAGEQPISVHYEGDEGKPWKPCKSMRRVLVGVWGSDGNAYIGRSMILYRDDSVTFGGQAVGGIRISHMSNITSAITMSLTATKKSKKPFTVNPLAVSETAMPTPPAAPATIPSASASPLTEEQINNAKIVANKGKFELEKWWIELRELPGEQTRFKDLLPELKRIAGDADVSKGLQF